MEKSYRMIKGYGEASFVEKKSRFISYTEPVYCEEDAIKFVAGIKKKHYDATHNCSAYIIGDSCNIQRSSDDGEPSGTAGIPILEVLRKEGLTNTAIVVTRYFGGIMLGAGGLIRAYTEGAAIAVKAAGIVSVQPFALFKLTFDYSQLSKLQYEIPKNNYIISYTEYLEAVTMKLLAAPESSEKLIADIAQWTNGSASIEHIDTIMLKVDEVSKEIL